MNNEQLREDLRKKFYQQFAIFNMIDLEGIGEDAIFDFILAHHAKEIENLRERVEGLNVGWHERTVDTSSHDDSFEEGAEIMQRKALAIIREEI